MPHGRRAGRQFAQTARDIKRKGWQTVVDTNVTGTWHMTQVFGNAMLDGRGGSIVQVVALLGFAIGTGPDCVDPPLRLVCTNAPFRR